MNSEPFGQPALSLEGRLELEVSTVPAMLHARAEGSRYTAALWRRDAHGGAWSPTCWGDYRDNADRIAAGLRHLGLVRGERVGIIAPNSQRWDSMQMGILAARGVVVGMDPHDLDENLNAMAQRCELSALVVQDPSWIHRLGAETRKRLRFTIYLKSAGAAQQGIGYDDLLRIADSKKTLAWPAAQPDDPATIIFTSGTTGDPKGIQYTHRQICFTVASILEAFPDVNQDSRLVCWLPLSNMFQRIINLVAIGSGAQIYYVDDPRAIMSQLDSIEPHLFIGVPRFYQKLYQGMMNKIEQGPSWQQRLAAWALRVGERYADATRHGRHLNIADRLRLGLADHLVLNRLRGVMGSKLRYLVSGSAPMPLWLLERFHAMGLLVLEAYGMSENVIPIASNRLHAYRFGTVGRPMSGCEVRLAEDGELLVRGPGVASGYYREEQNGLLDSEGFLTSGDYATIDADGFITLTGRKSEIFKTSTGRRIAPVAIESYLAQAPSVEYAAVFGAGRPFLVAVLSVAAADTQPSGLKAHCERLRR